MEKIKILKDNFPCKECITFPICRNRLVNSLKEHSCVIRSAYDTSRYNKMTLYCCAYSAFNKCSIYEKYIKMYFNYYNKIEKMNCIYDFEEQISEVIEKVFKLTLKDIK